MDQISCGNLQGFLLAFEILNTDVDHIPTFRFEQVAVVGDPQSSMMRHLKPNENYEVRLRPLEQWRQALAAEVPQWLFARLRLPEGQEHREISQTFLSNLDRAFGRQVAAAWRVEIEAADGRGLRPWYEATWSDFLFQSNDELFLLHLGLSD